MIVAGEASGDAHGAELMAALRGIRSDLKLIGAGGPKMLAEGQEQVADLSRHAVVGLTEVLRHYPKLLQIFQLLVSQAREHLPEVVVLIDYPGFNLRLAKRLRRLLPLHRLVYYISPQVWAWKEHRAKQMARDLDLVLAIFPFEPAWYKERVPGLRVEWVGHPMLDRLNTLVLGQYEPGRIALMPGSRKDEIRRHLPAMWDAASLIFASRPDVRFVVLSPNQQRQEEVIAWIEAQPPPKFEYECYGAYQLSHLNRCELALVKSGTGSLDCAFVSVPQIVVYKVNPVTYLAAKYVVKIKHLSMVNVLAKNPPVVPELIQHEFTGPKLAQRALDLLRHPEKRAEMKQRMYEVVASLGGSGASKRAAFAVLAELARAKKE